MVGESGSGKTTALESLIRHYVAHGLSVGAIKHTHHPINTAGRGDTARLRRAGAEPVILAGDRKAVVFAGDDASVIEYASPRDLVARFTTDVLLIEGFKSAGEWPRVELRAGEWLTVEELVRRCEASRAS